jgi:hypothetical protein
MSEQTLRGYMLRQAVNFIDSYYSREQATQLKAQLPAPLRDVLSDIDPVQWYPRDFCAALHRGIASVKGDSSAAYEDLIKCGEYIASEATNTYMRLILKIVSPSMFVNKVPTFWQRDHKSGKFSVEEIALPSRKIKMRLSEVGGFDHIGPCAIGFLRFGLNTVGLKNVRITQHGWSMASPAPDEVAYDIAWD